MAVVKSNQNKMLSMIKSQSDELSALSRKVGDLVLRMNLLLADNESFQSRITIIEEKITLLRQFAYNRNPAFIHDLSETLDRQSRANNILLFNLPEVATNTVNPISDELTLDIIFKFLDLDIHPLHMKRLGVYVSSAARPRPLKITLPNCNEVLQVFSNQEKLKSNQTWSNLQFSSDRTKMQRDLMSYLRQELFQRRSNGEDDLFIKYFMGTPYLSKKTNNYCLCYLF